MEALSHYPEVAGQCIRTVPQMVLYDPADHLAGMAVESFMKRFHPGRPLSALSERVAVFTLSGPYGQPRFVSTRFDAPAPASLADELKRMAALAPRGAREEVELGLGIGADFVLVHLIVSTDTARWAETRQFVQRAARRLEDSNTRLVLWALTDRRSQEFEQLWDLTDAVGSVSRILVLPAALTGVYQTPDQQAQMVADMLTDLTSADLGALPSPLLQELFFPRTAFPRNPKREAVLPVEPPRPLLVIGAHTTASGRYQADDYLAHALAAFALRSVLLPDEAHVGTEEDAKLAERIQLIAEGALTEAENLHADLSTVATDLRDLFKVKPLLSLAPPDRRQLVRHQLAVAREPVTGTLAETISTFQSIVGTHERLGCAEIQDLIDKEIGERPGAIRGAIWALRKAMVDLAGKRPAAVRPAPDFIPDDETVDPCVGLAPLFPPLAPYIIWVLLLVLFAGRMWGAIGFGLLLCGVLLTELGRVVRYWLAERRAARRPLEAVDAYLKAYAHWASTIWFPQRQYQVMCELLNQLEQAVEKWRIRCAEHDREAAYILRELEDATWTAYQHTAGACKREVQQLRNDVEPIMAQRDWLRRLDRVQGHVQRDEWMAGNETEFGRKMRTASYRDLEALALDWASDQVRTVWRPAPVADGQGNPGQFLASLERFCTPPGVPLLRMLFCQYRESPVGVVAAARRYHVVEHIDAERVSVWVASEWYPDEALAEGGEL